jgi:hypothetical protein
MAYKLLSIKCIFFIYLLTFQKRKIKRKETLEGIRVGYVSFFRL